MPERYSGSKRLVVIATIESLLDSNGKTECDIYNAKGGLLLKKGSKPPASLSSKTIYAYEHEKPRYKKGDLTSDLNDFDSAGSASTAASASIEFSGDREAEIAAAEAQKQKILRKKQVTDKVGSKIVRLYDSSIDAIKEILDSERLTKKEVNFARDVIEETYRQDRFDLITCISELRDADTYTYNHSMSVYVIFAQAMEDLSKYIHNDQFFSLFKSLNRNINFNKDSIKKYSLGALMHDYGKMLIDKGILNKPAQLTDAEFGQMKKHPLLGVEELVRHGLEDRPVLEIVGNHHAKYMTFRGEKQSPLAQLCNIVDVFDACNSPRVYKSGFSYAKTKSILMNEMLSNEWDRFLFETVVQDTLDKIIRYRNSLFSEEV